MMAAEGRIRNLADSYRSDSNSVKRNLDSCKNVMSDSRTQGFSLTEGTEPDDVRVFLFLRF